LDRSVCALFNARWAPLRPQLIRARAPPEKEQTLAPEYPRHSKLVKNMVFGLAEDELVWYTVHKEHGCSAKSSVDACPETPATNNKYITVSAFCLYYE